MCHWHVPFPCFLRCGPPCDNPDGHHIPILLFFLGQPNPLTLLVNSFPEPPGLYHTDPLRPAMSIISLPVTEYIITCSSEVSVDGDPPLSSSSTFNLTVWHQYRGTWQHCAGGNGVSGVFREIKCSSFFPLCFQWCGCDHRWCHIHRVSTPSHTQDLTVFDLRNCICRLHSRNGHFKAQCRPVHSVKFTSGDTTAALIGGVVGSVLVLVLLFAAVIVICMVLWRRRRKMYLKPPLHDPEEKGKFNIWI